MIYHYKIILLNYFLKVVPVPQTEVDELKDIFREYGDQNSLAIRDVAANTELKQVLSLGENFFSHINSGHAWLD